MVIILKSDFCHVCLLLSNEDGVKQVQVQISILPKVKIENNELRSNNEIFEAVGISDACAKRKL